jgi:L-aminopeptidase/D-esterase-like protein
LAVNIPGQSLAISDAVAALPDSPMRDVTILLLLLGFGLKAGLVPLHVWLPLAHPAAPMPASAVLSGAIIKAGIIGLVRFLPFEAGAPGWGIALGALGLFGAFYAVAFGVLQRNPKTILAYSSVSQMGVVMAALGFGLAAGDELALLLSQSGRGLPMGAGVPPVPVVPAAILFDLGNGGNKNWGLDPPYRRLTREAFANLGQPGSDGHGAIGAGHGARSGSRAGGIGSLARDIGDGVIVGALIAANSFGEVYAGAPPDDGPVEMPKLSGNRDFGRQNTVIGAVATNAPLTRAQALRVAMVAQSGLARVVRPVHTQFDGDCLFAISTAPPEQAPVDDVQLAIIATVAADLVALATRQAVGLY